METETISFVYFGGEPLGVPVLNELAAAGFFPRLIVCNPDRPVGRKHVLTAPPVKRWAQEHTIPVLQPETLADPDFIQAIRATTFDVSVVVAYNKIMPTWLIDLPTHGTLNVHPSLLPLLRGASPIRSSILLDMRTQCGVTIMQMDAKMDHGPIVTQVTLEIAKEEWPMPGHVLDATLATLGGTLLAEVLPGWVAGSYTPTPQNHTLATYCHKIDRADGQLNLDPLHLPVGAAAYTALLQIRAYDDFPGTFFIHKGQRVKIIDAHLDAAGTLCIDRVVPEGKTQQAFAQYVQTLGTSEVN